MFHPYETTSVCMSVALTWFSALKPRSCLFVYMQVVVKVTAWVDHHGDAIAAGGRGR